MAQEKKITLILDNDLHSAFMESARKSRQTASGILRQFVIQFVKDAGGDVPPAKIERSINSQATNSSPAQPAPQKQTTTSPGRLPIAERNAILEVWHARKWEEKDAWPTEEERRAIQEDFEDGDL